MIMQTKQTAQMYITTCALFAVTQDTMKNIAMLFCINYNI